MYSTIVLGTAVIMDAKRVWIFHESLLKLNLFSTHDSLRLHVDSNFTGQALLLDFPLKSAGVPPFSLFPYIKITANNDAYCNLFPMLLSCLLLLCRVSLNICVYPRAGFLQNVVGYSNIFCLD